MCDCCHCFLGHLLLAIFIIAFCYFGLMFLAVVILAIVHLYECLCPECPCLECSCFEASVNASVNTVKEITKPMRNNVIAPSDIVMVRNPDGNLQMGIISIV